MERSTKTPVSELQSKEDLLRKLRASEQAIRACGVSRLQLFGSFARGTAIGQGSDVDLLVEFEPGEKSWDHFLELSLLLEEILGRQVELVTRESLSPYIGPKILEEAEDVPLGA